MLMKDFREASSYWWMVSNAWATDVLHCNQPYYASGDSAVVRLLDAKHTSWSLATSGEGFGISQEKHPKKTEMIFLLQMVWESNGAGHR